MSGLGYWVMIANFISRAIKSKRMRILAKKATDIRKLINQVSLTQTDSPFLAQHSKSSLNFLMQLCTALIVPEIVENGGPFGGTGSGAATPPALLGISSLFEQSGFGDLIKSLSPHLSKLEQEKIQVLADEESTEGDRKGRDSEKLKLSLKQLHSKKKGENPAFCSTSDENLKKDFKDQATPPRNDRVSNRTDKENKCKSSAKQWKYPRNTGAVYPEVSGSGVPSPAFQV
ncbi:hypothetical protein Avbf_07099 [Armadillidium vulgare]|nr:hypothetical protein Avbf_07099 [Armadillidium vulgare]